MEGGEDSSWPSGPNPPPFQYHEIPSTFSGAFSFPWEAESGSLSFMDLLGIQDYASVATPSVPNSLLNFTQPPLPPPPEQPARPDLLPSTASTAPEPSEVVTNKSPTQADSSCQPPSSDEGQTSKAAEELGEEAEEEEERSIDQGRTKKQSKPKKTNQKKQRQPRFAFLTKSKVDHLDDGYRWRKYGQKAVKNSTYPRSYYRCTTAGCGVKKRIERSLEDPSFVVTTYEGQHTHLISAMSRGRLGLSPEYATHGTGAVDFGQPPITSPSLIHSRSNLYAQQHQYLHHLHPSLNSVTSPPEGFASPSSSFPSLINQDHGQNLTSPSLPSAIRSQAPSGHGVSEIWKRDGQMS
ncbi:hypothetical protein SAY86_015155 [Trapa natans]|uniref:WRKY domain-containing protein n=1 Tax=Trapa natans TaxID=22666 RepID=A0AAN7QK51_TRANT|nr:hypothetical protein SAY86_015155 [Trapa natans]